MNRLLLIANYDYINTALSLSGIEDEVKTIKDKFELMQYKIEIILNIFFSFKDNTLFSLTIGEKSHIETSDKINKTKNKSVCVRIKSLIVNNDKTSKIVEYIRHV